MIPHLQNLAPNSLSDIVLSEAITPFDGRGATDFMKRIELTGQRFGRLLVVKFIDSKRSLWQCKCDCGTIKNIESENLRYGYTKSCGCLSREVAVSSNTVHGMHGTKEYYAWTGMISRCYSKSCDQYKNYGGRGISVCERWRNSFELFFIDMGLSPSKRHSIDRIINDGNYEPLNCRWATKKQQDRNKRTNNWVEYNGEKMIFIDFKRKISRSWTFIHNRLKLGMTIQQIGDLELNAI